LLAAEGLSCLLKHRDQSPALTGLKVAPSAPAVNHLLFADYSLLFFQATRKSAVDVKDVFTKYCNVSGQRINMKKSSIFFSKGDVQRRGDCILKMN
jgi:hypothetical protein